MNAKQEYEALLKQQNQVNQALKNRCIECGNYNKKTGDCLRHGQVPNDFIYQKNECEDWDYLPF